MTAVVTTILIAGCTSVPNNTYPSLAIRDIERVRGNLAVSKAAPVAVVPLPGATIAQLGDLEQQATDAHQRFVAATPAARNAGEASGAASVGSEAWAHAQVLLAGLEAIRSEAMIALADLDRLYVDAVVDSGSVALIAETRSSVMTMVEQENEVIDALIAGLD